VGLFALAVFQAQPGCGGAEPESSAPVVAEPAASAPVDEVEPPVEPEASAPAGPADGDDPSALEPSEKAAVGTLPAANAEAPAFIGASKSGFVMQPPRPKKNAATQQAQTPSQRPQPQQQNARPGT
jgi:hypothetical protein